MGDDYIFCFLYCGVLTSFRMLSQNSSESAAHIDTVVKTIDNWGQPAEIRLSLKSELGWLKVGLIIFSKTNCFK